ncbi:dipeptidase PepV [Streptococcus loxodontisalivarius]|uniref:Succinyl-diaminopimelate desuccinylase n=1 Tax=Streptococcus loxodontisalivarius TaxID=1349415 RepID=A0ABS2PS99_9STRE|nr:dipeptidase PepV [Streptococcus loxodontisalivarius]MBM7642918.1 succinyl-diaminopimelate desuccinylase [Streptococcus loxodontisalivarius]
MNDWKAIIDHYKEQFLNDLDGLLRIPSVKDPKTASPNQPFGSAIDQALNYMLSLGERDGFRSYNCHGYAGHLEIGQGESSIGILSHLDVVPADPDQWDSDPFTSLIKDGKLYARGSLDDKGPSLMAYYAVKILNDLGVEWKKRLRLIYGTDEENGWEGVDHYFKEQDMPDFGLVPDGIFPMIYAEKGSANLLFKKQTSPSQQLIHFEAGSAFNQVPDRASAQLKGTDQLAQSFQDFLTTQKLKGQVSFENDIYELTLIGQAAHAANPAAGLNAASLLSQFLIQEHLDQEASQFLAFLDRYFIFSPDADKLGLVFQDQDLGNNSLNLALLSYHQGQIEIGVNFRYPASFSFETASKRFQEIAEQEAFDFEIISHQKASQTDLDLEETQLLLDIYREKTGDLTPPLAIGGITYGRLFKKGLTFGPAFLNKPATLHQPNEYILLDDLFLALEIYLEGLYRLATVEGSEK